MIYTNKDNMPLIFFELSKGHNVGEFLEGMRAAKAGIPHSQDNSNSFTAGYSAQYQFDQQGRGTN